MVRRALSDPLAEFHTAVREWFTRTFSEPTRPQAEGWPAIARGESTLIFAPTGSGKTLAAFLWCLDRLMFSPPPPKLARCRVLYVSPLKALAVDVEKNLRVPLDGIARTAAELGEPYVTPAIAIRTGDTPQADRARFQREPADILITTPESLYLLLTSRAREALASVDTVIIDEIHALVPTKRGAHLALSLERLTSRCGQPPQRIGLSATQRPLDEVARFLGGAKPSSAVVDRAPARGRRSQGTMGGADGRDLESLEHEFEREFAATARHVEYRPVTIVDTGAKKDLKLTIEVPIEGLSGQGSRDSSWSAIHPRLLELIRTHRTTLIFTNSRRLAERLSGAINELAGEVLVRSHHGSLARAQRSEVEDLLKAGALRALVATSSLELGIDMGAVDLVVQIEAPPSVASGLQRIGRSGHHVSAVSEGVIFPKFRGDLVACAAATRAMHDGAVEASRYPRNPLDVLAQQIVAMVSMDDWQAGELFRTIRGAAPFAELGRGAFDGVLDMLSGHYPSDEFAELRPRLTWNRVSGTLRSREGAKRVAIANGGTIPDRGLYGVFLLGAEPSAARVGELDEEMVFETKVGETFVLGASSWRIEEITHDRVLVSAAPGQPGKMPFWKGDRAGRPLELGLAIGKLTRDLLRMPPPAAIELLRREHDVEPRAAETLLQYLRDQMSASHAVPDLATVVIERVRDELGDWRVCVLSPRGGRIHAPWAMAAAARIQERRRIDVETIWGDDGFVVRFPDVDEPPDPQLLLPEAEDVYDLVVRQLGGTALFAGKFRENAARSLLLPKRRAGMRAPLWQQRKRAADLLAVAARFGSFPVLLETYRECLRDFFDMPSLQQTLSQIHSQAIRVVTVDSERPSPFAASLLFSYVASFLYDGDAPLAERRAQALSVDQTQLRELVGDAELRELLDPDAITAIERQLQRLDPQYQARNPDTVHDMLLAIGDLTLDELRARSAHAAAGEFLQPLLDEGRAIEVRVAGQPRFIAAEDAARYRDGLGVPLPPGIPGALLEPKRDALGDLTMRYARTHGPFTVREFSARYGLADRDAEAVLSRLAAANRLIEGEFRPGGTRREWTDPEVLRLVRRRSLAKLRREVEPVDQALFARFLTTWQGIVAHRSGPDALLDAIEQLQGAPLPTSILETEILPARVDFYDPGDLDALISSGEVVWVGLERLGEHDGRIALYLADQLGALLAPAAPPARGAARRHPHEGHRQLPQEAGLSERERVILEALRSQGASFFGSLHESAGGGYPDETVKALWNLAWQGLITNDTFHALRAFVQASPPRRRIKGRQEATPFRSRRLVPSSAEGRWTVVPSHRGSHTAWVTATALQLLTRHGVLSREAVAAESIAGGFSTVYPVLKAMEDNGRVRRGYFVAGLGATQFALPGALDRLRSTRGPGNGEAAVLAATDPANPYGAALRFPAVMGRQPRSLARVVGATVILVDGALAAYLTRGDRQLMTWLPDSDPERARTARAIARVLIDRARSGGDSPRGMLLEEIDGDSPSTHPLAPFLAEAGFVDGALGFAPSQRAFSGPRQLG